MVCATHSCAHRHSKSGSASRSHDDFERLSYRFDAVATDAGAAGIGGVRHCETWPEPCQGSLRGIGETSAPSNGEVGDESQNKPGYQKADADRRRAEQDCENARDRKSERAEDTDAKGGGPHSLNASRLHRAKGRARDRATRSRHRRDVGSVAPASVRVGLRRARGREELWVHPEGQGEPDRLSRRPRSQRHPRGPADDSCSRSWTPCSSRARRARTTRNRPQLRATPSIGHAGQKGSGPAPTPPGLFDTNHAPTSVAFVAT